MNSLDLPKYFNKVKEYIKKEYSEELSTKMSKAKYIDVSIGYIKNCIYLQKSVPYTANGLVRFLKKTN